MVEIVQDPHPTLRATASIVPDTLFGTETLAKIVQNMKKALEAQEDGVAIAAPQIAVSYRIFVISKKILPGAADDVLCINPEIVRLGKKKEAMHEGCLSVRWKYGMVKRATTATIRAYTVQGNEFVLRGKDLVAQVFQHEIDHLDGVLFIDTATGIEDIPPQQHPHA